MWSVSTLSSFTHRCAVARFVVELVDAHTQQDTLEAYQTLESLVDEKKIWGIGVSNIYDKDELSWLIKNTRYPINYVQNRWYEGNGWDWDGESYSPPN